MTPDERTLLSNFLADLAQARAQGKDAEAEAMIAKAFAANPDAAYLIVQHAILSDEALRAAQARIAQLESGQGSSFFGGARQQQAQPQYQPATAVPVSQPGGFSPFASVAGSAASCATSARRRRAWRRARCCSTACRACSAGIAALGAVSAAAGAAAPRWRT